MSAIIKFHSGSILYKHLGKKTARTKSVVLATPEGELHEFGILISALLCANYNIKFIYLGANMPWDALSEASNQIAADILLVGVSSMFQNSNSEFLEEYFLNVRSGLKSECELWIGGMQFLTKPLMQDGIISVNDLEQLDRKLQALLS
jgi:methanogenic corrinoid protein MtbC1